MSRIATRTFRDLRRLLSGDHPLNCTVDLLAPPPCGDFTNTVSTPWRANSSITRIRYGHFTRLMVRRICEHHFDLPFSGEVPHALKPGCPAWDLP